MFTFLSTIFFQFETRTKLPKLCKLYQGFSDELLLSLEVVSERMSITTMTESDVMCMCIPCAYQLKEQNENKAKTAGVHKMHIAKLPLKLQRPYHIV